MPRTPRRVRTCPHHSDSPILASRCRAQARGTSPEEGEGQEDIRFLLCLDQRIRHSAFHFWVNVLRCVSRCRLIFPRFLTARFGRDPSPETVVFPVIRQPPVGWVSRSSAGGSGTVSSSSSSIGGRSPFVMSPNWWQENSSKFTNFVRCSASFNRHACRSSRAVGLSCSWRSLDDTPGQCNPVVTSHYADARLPGMPPPFIKKKKKRRYNSRSGVQCSPGIQLGVRCT